MRARDLRTPSRWNGDAWWNAAAVAGLLLIGLVIGGFLGVILDRQGLLGGPEAGPERPAIVADEQLQEPPDDPAAASRAPCQMESAVRIGPDDPFDREALEAALQSAAEDGTSPGQEPQPTAPGQAVFLPAIPVPDRGLQGPAPWQAHAIAVAPSAGRPMIAIVLDDLGLNRRNARQAIALPGPLTLSFMTYAEGLAEMTAAASEAGHELMLHVPMQPLSPTIDPGPNVLVDGLPAAEMTQRLVWGLDRFEGYVGINNHMGSRLTASPEAMALVMGELKARGLMFLDSLTSRNSVAGQLAARAGVPYAERDVFLDNEPHNRLAIERQLTLLEQVARERGYAVGIGHPHSVTMAALEAWIPEMQARGFALVPITAVVRHRMDLAALRNGGDG